MNFHSRISFQKDANVTLCFHQKTQLCSHKKTNYKSVDNSGFVDLGFEETCDL